MEFSNCVKHSYASWTRKLSLHLSLCHARRIGAKKFKRKLSLLMLVFEPWAWALRSEGECLIHWDKQHFQVATVSEPYECINAFIPFYQYQIKNVKREHSLWRLCWNISGFYSKNPQRDNMSSRYGGILHITKFPTSRKFKARHRFPWSWDVSSIGSLQALANTGNMKDALPKPLDNKVPGKATTIQFPTNSTLTGALGQLPKEILRDVLNA